MSWVAVFTLGVGRLGFLPLGQSSMLSAFLLPVFFDTEIEGTDSNGLGANLLGARTLCVGVLPCDRVCAHCLVQVDVRLVFIVIS